MIDPQPGAPPPSDEHRQDRQVVTCDSCGFTGDMELFLAKDPTDTICPQCGERVELTYEV